MKLTISELTTTSCCWVFERHPGHQYGMKDYIVSQGSVCNFPQMLWVSGFWPGYNASARVPRPHSAKCIPCITMLDLCTFYFESMLKSVSLVPKLDPNQVVQYNYNSYFMHQKVSQLLILLRYRLVRVPSPLGRAALSTTAVVGSHLFYCDTNDVYDDEMNKRAYGRRHKVDAP